jgi:thiamine phosphate synthase YjbQ (UPF0047 family)
MTQTGPYWRVEIIDGRVREYTSGRCRPMEVQKIAAMELCTFLNREMHHGGRWVVGWAGQTNEVTPGGLIVFGVPTTMGLVWLDQDEDVQFTVEIDERLDDIIRSGPEHWCDQAEQAWREWASHIKEVDVRPDQTIKAAQGERPKDPTQTPDVS